MRHVTAKRDANPYSQARRAAPHLTCASKVIIMGTFRIDNAGSFGSSAHRPAPWSCVAFPCVDELLLIELIDHRSGNPFSLLQWIQRVTQPSSHPNDARSCPPAPLAADIRQHHRSLHFLLISRTKKSEIENDMPSLRVCGCSWGTSGLVASGLLGRSANTRNSQALSNEMGPENFDSHDFAEMAGQGRFLERPTEQMSRCSLPMNTQLLPRGEIRPPNGCMKDVAVRYE